MATLNNKNSISVLYDVEDKDIKLYLVVEVLAHELEISSIHYELLLPPTH